MTKLILAVVLVLLPPSVAGAVLMTQDKALSVAFPNNTPERHTIFLTKDELRDIQTSARARQESEVVTYYSGKLADGSDGWAFFETHVVRTMPETFMTVVDAAGSVRFVEILAFNEPADYLPPKRWLDQFKDKRLDEDLMVKRGLRNVTGATLTTRALTDGVRRALATWSLIQRSKTGVQEKK